LPSACTADAVPMTSAAIATLPLNQDVRPIASSSVVPHDPKPIHLLIAQTKKIHAAGVAPAAWTSVSAGLLVADRSSQD
ncbi:TPA: hypothetical protein ACIE75_005503, partial [Klebsiella pneumoniae]